MLLLTEIDSLFPPFSLPTTWFASGNIHLATPNDSRATTPVGDMETFDPSRPSVSPVDSVLLPIGKVPGYLDAALKALALHTEARTSFITYASSTSHPPSNLIGIILFFFISWF